MDSDIHMKLLVCLLTREKQNAMLCNTAASSDSPKQNKLKCNFVMKGQEDLSTSLWLAPVLTPTNDITRETLAGIHSNTKIAERIFQAIPGLGAGGEI